MHLMRRECLVIIGTKLQYYIKHHIGSDRGQFQNVTWAHWILSVTCVVQLDHLVVRGLFLPVAPSNDFRIE